MSEFSASKIREARKARAARMAGGKSESDVDASGWKPEGETEPLDTETKTGMRPVSKRAFKKGGKVDGKEAHHHAGRAKRKSGGALTANGLINRDVKDANAERPGGRDHVGGYKHGGKLKKAGGGETGKSPVGAKSYYPKASSTPEPEYNRSSVNDAIAASNRAGRRIGGKEAKMIHSLLKGRTGRSGGGPLGGFNAVTDPVVASAVANHTQNAGGVAPQRMNFSPAGTAGMLHFKKGGKVEHSDEKEDRALIDKMVKPSARTGKKDGGGKWIAGAIKHPGALHKELGVPEGKKIPQKKLEKAAHAGGKEGKRARLAETLEHMHHCEGGRAERKDGGRTGKGKMNVNIIIAQPSHHDASQQPPGPGTPPGPPPTAPAPAAPPPPAAMPVMPMGMPGGMGAPMGGAPAAPPAGGAPRPMGRNTGGRTYPIEDGAGGGEGRLQKIKAYGLPPEPGRSV